MTNKYPPTLRFKDFDNEWQEKKLGDIARMYQPKTISQSELTETGFPVFGANGYIGYYFESNHNEDQVTISARGENTGTPSFVKGPVYITGNSMVVNTDVDEIDKYFLYNSLLSRSLKKYVTGGAQPQLTRDVLNIIQKKIPSLPEQSAIGSLFQSLDELLAAYKDNLANYQAFKASMLSKMFPKAGQTTPGIRLEGFDGEWEVDILKNLATFSKGNGYTKGDLVEVGSPIILYGQLYINYQTIISDPSTYVTTMKDNSVLSDGGEVIVPASGESAEDISRASVVKNPGIILGGDLNIIKVNQNIINPVFLALTISNGSQQRELIKRAQGKSVVHLRNNDLEKVVLAFPSLEEQQTIGSFFSNLDDLISTYQVKIDQLETLKKKLLQDMFV